MDKSRRGFLKKSVGYMGVAAATVALSKISYNEANAMEIGITSKSPKNPVDVSGQCGIGMGCGGGGGQCGIGMGCSGDGGDGGSGQCGIGMGCGGGGGQCGIGMGCSGS